MCFRVKCFWGKTTWNNMKTTSPLVVCFTPDGLIRQK